MDYVSKSERYKVAPLFEGWEKTMVWSCLQGFMGTAWCDHLENPVSAGLVVGDCCFLAGRPDGQLIKTIDENLQSDWFMMIPRTESWSPAIETVYSGKYEKTLRYAIKKEPDIFDQKYLLQLACQLPSGYWAELLNEAHFDQIREEDELKDLCSQFASWKEYEKYGIGVVLSCEAGLAAGASSYTVYDKGIEIEIDTKKAHRRKGLATACGSKLILECLKQGRYPSWDAHDLRSVELAKKLGYHFDREYLTYIITK